jgi:hypothetical protein
VYTAEAFDDYLSHLTAAGCVSISRLAVDPPRETLRLALTAREALERHGVDEPERHIAVLRARVWGTTLLCKAPLSAEALLRLRSFAGEHGYLLEFDPDQTRSGPFSDALRKHGDEKSAFLAAYPFDVRPATDEAPFFFDYYKWRDAPGVVGLAAEHPYASKVPIGHGLLLITLIVTSILAALGIVWPVRGLRGRANQGQSTIYFAGLGVGYLLVEVGLVQRLTFLLGHPTYALTVVLGTLLVSSGLGSAVVDRFAFTSSRLGFAVVAAVGFTYAVSRWAVPHCLDLPWSARLVVAISLIVPVGFVLGMPFPSGIRRLCGGRAESVTWSFAVNGFFTVIATSFAPLLAMVQGFSALFLAAAAAYAVAFLMLAQDQRNVPVPRASDS